MEGAKIGDSVKLLNDLYKTAEYSDLRIRCDGFYLQAHRAVVCTQSLVLRGMIQGKPGNYTIELAGEEPSIIGKILSFLYTRDYDNTIRWDFRWNQERAMNEFLREDSETPGSTPKRALSESGEEHDVLFPKTASDDSPLNDYSTLFVHAWVYTTAGKYGLSSLQSLAQEKFAKSLEREAWSRWTINELKLSLLLLYGETEESTRPLRESAICATSTHMQRVLVDEEFLTLLERKGEIGIDILKSLSDEKSKTSARKDSTSNAFNWIPWRYSRSATVEGNSSGQSGPEDQDVAKKSDMPGCGEVVRDHHDGATGSGKPGSDAQEKSFTRASQHHETKVEGQQSEYDIAVGSKIQMLEEHVRMLQSLLKDMPVRDMYTNC